jgi:hypothetical protein
MQCMRDKAIFQENQISIKKNQVKLYVNIHYSDYRWTFPMYFDNNWRIRERSFLIISQNKMIYSNGVKIEVNLDLNYELIE